MKSYNLFIKEDIQNEKPEEQPIDKKDIPQTELNPEVKNYTVEIQSGKEKTFEKLIKQLTRLCKVIKLPTPKVTEVGKKTYYVIKCQYKNDMSYEYQYNTLKDTLTEDAEKIKEELKKHKGSDSNYWITTEDVKKYNIELVDVIKPSNEWIILGVINHKEGLVKSAPNQQIPFELIPKDLSSNVCDHCKSERVRNKTVFIKNLENDEIIRVGGSCIKYYLGYDYEKILNYLTELNLFIDTFNEGGIDFEDFEFSRSRGFREEPTANVKDIIKYFFYYVKKKGYISKASAEKYNTKQDDKLLNDTESVEPTRYMTCTKDQIHEELLGVFTPPDFRKQKDVDEWNETIKNYGEIIEKENNDGYEKIVQYVEENYKENNFLFNVKNMIEAKYVKLSQMNYVLGACSMYYGKIAYEEYKKKKEEEQHEIASVSEWVGVVGEKIPLENLEITNISSFATDFGYSNVYKLKDDKGNIFTKFGTINSKFLVSGEDVIVGSKISATAEIKKHDEYKGVRQTTLGRLSKL